MDKNIRKMPTGTQNFEKLRINNICVGKIMYIYKLLQCFVLAFTLCSCETELEFRSDEIKPKLVLHCFPTSGEKIVLTLRTSRFFLSNDEIRDVTDATVTVWKNGSQVETLKCELSDGYKCRYQGNFCPAVGDEITIKASAPGFDDISCTAVMPPYPTISDVEHTDYIKKDYNVRHFFDGTKLVYDTLSVYLWERYNIVCRINDPTEISNYYRIEASTENINQYSHDTFSLFVNPLSINSDDIVFGMRESELFDSEENLYNIFSDELFNGKEYRLKFNVENWFENVFQSNHSNFFPIISKRNLCIELRNLSKEYYLYLRTRTAGDRVGVNIFSEPVQIYSNVEGGIGVLAPSSVSVYRIPLIIK